MAAADVLHGQQKLAWPSAARRFAQQFVDSPVVLGRRLLASFEHEGENPDFACSEDPSPLHGRIQQLPLLIQLATARGRIWRNRDLEEAGVQDGDAEALFIENGACLPHLLQWLVGVVWTPDVTNLGPSKAVAAQKVGGGERIVIDLVGGDAEFEVGERQGPEAAGQGSQRDGELTARKEPHTEIIAGDLILGRRDSIYRASLATESERNRFLAGLNVAPTRPEAAVAADNAASRPEAGAIIFGRLAEMWRKDFVECKVGGKALVAASTREKYLNHLANHILPRWKDTRLAEFRAKDVIDWLHETCESWYMMVDLRNIISGIITKAQEWEIIPESFANPMQRVKLPKKWEVREKRILDEDQTARVLARLEDPDLLINETFLDTGARISEVTGLRIKHVDLESGTVRIEQRNWRGDIDEPKTEKSKRTLVLGGLCERYKAWIASLPRKGPEDWVFPQADDPVKPRWDSGVRKALKLAAAAEGCDFPGFGPIPSGAPTSPGGRRLAGRQSRLPKSPATRTRR